MSNETNEVDAVDNDYENDSQPSTADSQGESSEEGKRGSSKRSKLLEDGAGSSKGLNPGAMAKNAASSAATSMLESSETGQKVNATVEKVNRVRKMGENIANSIRTASVYGRWFVTTVTNPYFWIVTAIVVGLAALGTNIYAGTTAFSQVFGTQRSSGGSGAAGEVLERLAQRAQWLAENHVGTTYAYEITSLGAAPSSALGAGNDWAVACPDIVAIIWGLPPSYVAGNGSVNAWRNFNNNRDLFQAYAFTVHTNGSFTSQAMASDGAQLEYPPAGAIVSMTSRGDAGHTLVMLTEELVIDNAGGGIGGGTAPRILSDAERGKITGWALPNNEGFEGTFITGPFDGMPENSAPNEPMPGLPPVPEWALATE